MGVVLLAGLWLAASAPMALAEDWGLISPGETTMDQVRARYGTPTRASTQKLDGYDAAQWVYENAQAPAGMRAMTVDFGLLKDGPYRPNVVRSFLLIPKPGTFSRQHVLAGWGEPTGVGTQGNAPAIMYEEGLFVTFDDTGVEVRSMLFTPRQPMPSPPAAPPR